MVEGHQQESHLKRRLQRTAGLVFLGSIACSAWAGGELNHGVVYYSPNQGDPYITSLVVERYGVGVIGSRDYGQDAQTIKDLNPDFEWYLYNSVTDNYISGPNVGEHQLIATIAAQHGWDPEDAYLHFYDDTELVLEGQTKFVPGWGGGSAASKADARVPLYYANLTRRAVNFSTPTASQLNKEVLVQLGLDEPFSGTSLYPDGLFLDNSANRLWNTGTILSGGHVLETPGHLKIGTNEFNAWHWNSNLGPFLTALKDTLETSDLWSMDGKKKGVMINISNSWTDTYVSMDVADIFALEFQYDPVRNSGSAEVAEAFRRDRLAADAGMRSFYAPLMQTQVAGGTPISQAEALYGSLCWFLTTRTDESLLFLFGGESSPAAAGWDTLTWRGCVDIANEELGDVVGDPYQFAIGTDPLGKSYTVWARDYDHGKVLLRNRGRWDEGIEPETEVSVPLPDSFVQVSISGALGDFVSEITLRNGEGALLLENPPETDYIVVTPLDRSDAPTIVSINYLDAATSGGPGVLFTIPRDGHVVLQVFNASGQLQDTLVDEFRSAGRYVTMLDSNELPSGMYFCRLSFAGQTAAARTWVLK